MTYRQIAYDKSKQKIADLETIFSNLYDLFNKEDINLSAFEIKLLTEKIERYIEAYQDAKKTIDDVPYKTRKDYNDIFDAIKYGSVIFSLGNFYVGYSILSLTMISQIFYKNNFVVDNDSDFDRIIKMVHNIMYNSINQFNKISSNFEQELHLTRNEVIRDNSKFNLEENRYNIANLIINGYLSHPIPLVKLLDYPQEIQDMIVNILQENLKTNQTNIITLIVMARQAIEKEKQKSFEGPEIERKKSRFKK